MDLAIILVHYHTPELAAEAVEALRRSLGEPALAGISSEIVLVDNGSDTAGRELLDALPVRRIDPGCNLGFGGGINRGVVETVAERSVVLNPDVLVEPGCLTGLLAELETGAAVAGPRFYLDRGRRFRIPPTEPRTRLWELFTSLADRGAPWTPRARRVWRRPPVLLTNACGSTSRRTTGSSASPASVSRRGMCRRPRQSTFTPGAPVPSRGRPSGSPIRAGASVAAGTVAFSVRY
jgi:GT2 family glycosyltransferase